MARSLDQNSLNARMTMKDSLSQCLLAIEVSVYCQIEELPGLLERNLTASGRKVESLQDIDVLGHDNKAKLRRAGDQVRQSEKQARLGSILLSSELKQYSTHKSCSISS